MSIGNRKMTKERPPAGQAWILALLLVGGVGMALVGCARSTLPRQAPSEVMTPAVSFDLGPAPGDHRATLDQYCVFCHNEAALTAGTVPGVLHSTWWTSRRPPRIRRCGSG